MKKHRRLILISFLFVAAIIVTVTATLQVQKQNGSRPATLQRADEDFYTVADYAASEPTEPQKRESRRVRAGRYNMHVDKGVDPKRFAINEERDSSFGTPSSHAPIEPALPAAQSDAVVIGEITNAQAFLSGDKTAVVSEFTLNISDVLKENLRAPFSVGDSLDAIRAGGGVRFPSGKVIRYGLDGKPLPRAGRRYLFFLKYNDDAGKDYVILTAYEFRNGRVFPLDGFGLSGTVQPPYAEYQKYRDLDESDFRSKVVDAISRNLGTKTEVERPR
jgi:hypothetical protein